MVIKSAPAATAPSAQPRQDEFPQRSADALLADGRVVSIRRVQAADLTGLLGLHDGADSESIRMRFFVFSRDAARRYVEHLVEADPAQTIALVASIDDHLVGVAAAEQVGHDIAEIALMVATGSRGLGVGTLLLEHLAAAAHDRGIVRFSADVLMENTAMLKVFREAGFAYDLRVHHGVVTITLDTSSTPAAIDAADARESVAEAASLRPLLQPRSVAVIGLRRDGSGIGNAVVTALRQYSFSGQIHQVHPHAATINGHRCVSRISQIEDGVDLAIIAVPAESVLDVLTEAADSGARAAVILTAGFGESGESGRELQRAVVEVARRHNMRIVGPNCLGLINPDPHIKLNASFSPIAPSDGGLAIATQSGGVGIAILQALGDSGTGVSYFISLGNKADVSSNDLLAAWQHDERVTSAGLYLESFGNALKFRRLAKRFALSKPLLAIVGGSSAGGRRAGASHTAAAATPPTGVAALFDQSGVIQCTDIDDLVATARLLNEQPLPRGGRLGIVGNAGGLGVLAADLAADHGLDVPAAARAATENPDRQVADSLDGPRILQNPVDLGAAATPDEFASTAQTLAQSGDVDAVLVILTATAVTQVRAVIERLRSALESGAAGRPVVLVTFGVDPAESTTGFCRMSSIDSAVRAISAAARYAQWRYAAGEVLPAIPTVGDSIGAQALIAHVLDSSELAAHGGWLDFETAAALLNCYDIRSAKVMVVHDARSAADAAGIMGYPVVAKSGDSAIVHKTERHMVLPHLQSAEQVLAAASRLLTHQEPVHDSERNTPVLIQQEIQGGVELAMGMVRDPVFGPMIMVAAGGTAIDVWNDRVFAVPPISSDDALRCLSRLKIWPLLSGYRGSSATDIPGLGRVMVALSRMATEIPELVEIDLNPIIALADKCVCVDAKIRIRRSAQNLGPDARSLSAP